DYDGDMLTLVRLLLPGVDQRVYNIKEKQLIKHFASIYDLPAEDLLNEYKNSGDVSKTIRDAVEKNNLSRVTKGNWSIEKVDRWLTKLTEFTKDDEQISHLKFAAKRCVAYMVLLVDNASGKPLPFGTLGVHKKEQVGVAGFALIEQTLAERKMLLESKMTEVENRVMMSNYQLIRHGQPSFFF
ncbi:hypothetical protein ANCDUO_15414, partial [Ancylostoma duodenale]